MGSLLEELVEEVWEISLDRAPERVRAEAVKATLDTLAVAVAGYEKSRLAREYAVITAPKLEEGSTVLGGWWRSTPHLAASANSFSSHALEYDDWLREGYVHAGSVTVPVAVALSEGARTWRDVLEAVVVGYEVAGRVGYAAGKTHYRTWHSTGTVGALGAAASASRILGLTAEEAANALAIAGYYASGLWGFIEAGSTIKPMSPAHASLIGVLAAHMARSGFKTNTRLLEGDRGFFKAMAPGSKPERALEPPWDYAILRNSYKLYPCCRHTHSAVAAAIEVSGEVRVGEVESVEVVTYSEAAAIAGISRPRSLEEARFSLPYVVAAALTYGRLGLSEMEAGLKDARVSQLVKKVTVRVDEGYDRVYPEKQPSLVRVRYGGVTIERIVEYPPGDPENPVGLDEIVKKARGLGGSVPRFIGRVLEAVRGSNRKSICSL